MFKNVMMRGFESTSLSGRIVDILLNISEYESYILSITFQNGNHSRFFYHCLWIYNRDIQNFQTFDTCEFLKNVGVALFARVTVHQN